MDALVSTNSRFKVTPDGAMWTSYSELSYSFWTRYLEAYEGVSILARAGLAEHAQEGWSEVTGPDVRALPIADFHAPVDFARRYPRLRREIASSLRRPHALQFRAPCVIGLLFWRMVERGRPFGVEVIGDPWELFAPRSFTEPMRPIYRRWFARRLKYQCAAATAAAYVTEGRLQSRYPASLDAFVTSFSDVHLTAEAFAPVPRRYSRRDHVALVSVGNLEQLYKAPHVLIDAVEHCVRGGADLSLIFVGGGQKLTQLSEQARLLGIADRVHFAGNVASGAGVRRYLDEADIFILPSFQEGLPRAMVEAMARGLPCIGSAVGGIPELLAREELVPPGDVHSLAEKLIQLSRDPKRMTRLSERNLKRSQDFREGALRNRRVSFYRTVREQTQEWYSTHH